VQEIILLLNKMMKFIYNNANFHFNINLRALLILLVIFTSTNLCFAVKKERGLPRFVTLKSNNINARSGPNKRHPIEWTYTRKGEPVEILAEYEHWRKIRDYYGHGGWVHSSMLSPQRSVIINAKSAIYLFYNPDEQSYKIAQLMPEVRCGLLQEKHEWCKIKCEQYVGWIQKQHLFGVYQDEW